MIDTDLYNEIFGARYKAIVLSDTHGDTTAIERLLPLINACDLVVHLGDHDDDLLRFRHEITTRVCCVRGNNDIGSSCPVEAITELGGKRIYVSHGDRLGVRGGVGLLAARALRSDCEIALYGHTHVASVDKTGPIAVMNPGSLSWPRTGPPSYGMLYGDEKIFLKIIV